MIAWNKQSVIWKAWDFRFKLSKNIRAKRGFNAGTDKERLDDLHAMFADTGVQAVWCARGGYGCSRLLPNIDYKLIQSNPKVLIGYSDVTALLQAIYKKTGLICFHGPVGASELTDYTKEQVTAVLIEGKSDYTIQLASENQSHEDPLYHSRVIREGTGRGILVGGNLSLLAAMAGTDFEIDLKGKLLFIEDIGEKPYRVDRMLTQLRQAQDLQKLSGIALGVFADCEAKKDDLSLSLAETLEDRLKDLGIPVIYGISFGHISNQCTLPVGIEAELNTSNQTITLLENAVV